MSDLKPYIFHMVHDFVDFRLKELESICELINRPESIKHHTYSPQSSIFSCELESDDLAKQIASRSFLLKSISSLYNKAPSFDEMLKELEQHNPCLNMEKGDTFKIDVYTFGKIYTMEEKVEKIEKLVAVLKLEANDYRVCLNETKVKHRFLYTEEWVKIDWSSSDEFSETKNERKFLKMCYFGKFLCNGQNHLAHKYNLKERKYIGNTTMDPLLSLVMANMGHVRSNYLVYDPFVGTGSLLVGAAHFGAHVMGADLDFNMIHARGLSSRMGQKYRSKDETILNNLKQYGLEEKYVDVLCADFSTRYLSESFKFDAIITDPPYGIREKAKKIGKKTRKACGVEEEADLADLAESLESALKIEQLDNNSNAAMKRIPQHTKYMLAEIFTDLVRFASKHLAPNGRLVFWIPIYLELDRSTMT